MHYIIRKICILCLSLGYFSVVLGQEPLFTRIETSHSQVHFNNEIKDTKAHNILIYSNFYGGAGIGIGDVNNDGLLDLYFAGNQKGDRLYLNKGDFVFDDVTESAGILNRGGWSSGVLMADVNNDGWTDIYVTKELYDNLPNLRKNELYLNNQDGTFSEVAEAYGVNHDERTRHATFLDYDKDGWLDLYLLTQPPNPGNFSELYDIDKKQEKFTSRLFRNNRKGKFIDVTQEAGLFNVGFPNSVSASDLNNDGWTDLYVANDFDAPDWMYLNNGDGTFTNVINESLQHISYFSMGVDASDINNDGWLDVMVLDMQAEDNFRIKSNMSGMNPKAFWSVVENGGHYQYMFNALHLNQGAPKDNKKDVCFSDIAQMAGISNTDWSWSNLMADFDNDGWKDIFVSNGLLRDIRNTDSDKKFSNHVQEVANDFVAKNPNAGAVSIWEIFDLDEALKMIPSVPLNNYAYKNNGNLTFSKVIEEWGFDLPTFSSGAAYGDLDNDGDLDLVISNVNEAAYIYRNELRERDIANYLRIKITDKKSLRSPFGVKVKIDTEEGSQWYEFTNVRGMYSTSESLAHFGIGKQQTINQIEVTWWDGKKTVVSNVSANQVLEIDYSSAKKEKSQTKTTDSPLFTEVLPSNDLSFIHKENDFDDYEKQVLLPHKMSQFGPALTTGDINGDGWEDVYIGGAKGQAGKMFLQTPKGFKNLENDFLIQDKDFEDIDAAFFDYDKDGDLDLYVVSGGNSNAAGSAIYRDRLYDNDGSGQFTRNESVLPKFFESGSCVRPYDFDQDGDIDLFVGGRHVPWDYPSPSTSRLLENQEGKFKDITAKWAKELIKIGMVTDAQWTDIDQDGQIDLMIVGEWMPITVLRQNDNKHFKNINHELGLAQTQGWWYSIMASDLDDDGDQDFVVGNLGLNYKYKATTEEPFEVFYNDFDGNGSKDIVLSYFNFGKKYPLRGRSCSSEQVPMLKEKFPSYDLFASSELTSVYNPVQLDKSLNYHASTFASMLIENQGAGKFVIKPLPSEAQISSINTTIAADFDKDGYKDLLTAGNLFVAEIETPRNDAGIGLLMKGNEDHSFSPVSSNESGIRLPYDVKKMVKLDSPDGKHYIIAACNDDKLVLLKY